MNRGTGSKGSETQSLWMIVLAFSYWKRRGDTYLQSASSGVTERLNSIRPSQNKLPYYLSARLRPHLQVRTFHFSASPGVTGKLVDLSEDHWITFIQH